jgi:hypothetical protein
VTSSNSIVRRRATDVRLFGAAGYALVLQLGHPTIAAGVRDWLFAGVAAAHRVARPVMPPVLRRAGPTMLRMRNDRIAFGPFA